MADDVFGIVGTDIGGAYRVERVVAEGGFGVVYRALHSAFRAPVALKCLKIPQGFGVAEKGDFLEQFRTEAELLFRLSAALPTVVRPLHVDAFTSLRGDFVPFMVLEWLDGDTLNVVAERKRNLGQPLSLKRLMRLLDPVADTLDQAHDFPGPEGRVCVVHRDLKPENVFVAQVRGEETAKVLDFGIGKVKSAAERVAGRASQEDAGHGAFSPAYGAPEQWAPRRYGQTGPWTDVWGLALTMVEVLAGRPVIDGDEAAMMGTALDPARRPTPRREGVVVNDDVEAVFETALTVDPRFRYQRVHHFWGDLKRAVGTLDKRGSSPPSRPPEGLAPTVIPSAAPTPRVPELEAPPRRPRGEERPPALALEPGALPLRRPPASELADVGGGAGSPAERPGSGARRAGGSRAAPSDPVGEAADPLSLDLDALAAPLPPPRPVPPPRYAAPSAVGFTPIGAERSVSSTVTRLLPGLALCVVAVCISVGGRVYAARTGTPVPVGWVAGLVLLVGLALIAHELVGARAR